MRHTAGPDEKPLRSNNLFYCLHLARLHNNSLLQWALISTDEREKKTCQVAQLTSFKNETNVFFFLRLGIRSGKKVKGKELICFQHWKTQIDSSLAIFVHAFFFRYLPMCITKLLARYSKKWTSLKRNKT